MRAVWRGAVAVVVFGLLAILGGVRAEKREGVPRPDAKPVKVGSGFQFTEGPTSDAHGNVYFSDIPANRIHKRSPDGKITLFRSDSGATNGLAFD